jgi:endogenous inhibitor of DNA gyrase (YacG/DUF329 family)
MENSEAARRLASLRRRQEATCPICGRSFVRITKALYCSTSCKQKAQYRRRAELRNRVPDSSPAAVVDDSAVEDE